MSLTKEDIIKGLKEVTRKLEEGDETDSSRMGIVEKFLKNFPPPTTKSARNLSEFPAELLQLIFFYLPLCDLKSAVLVCKRWKSVAENSKLWEDKKLVLEEGENMTLFCAVEVARRRKIQTIQAEYDGTQNFKQYRYRYFLPVPNIYDTDTGTFFRYQFFPIPPKKMKIPGTGNSRYRYVTLWDNGQYRQCWH